LVECVKYEQKAELIPLIILLAYLLFRHRSSANFNVYAWKVGRMA
jgi:hypothetical protein